MEEKKSTNTYSFVNLYDIPTNESWLEDLAREGEVAVKLTAGGRVVCEEGEPLECRFRMQPTRKKESCPSEEQLELYESMGWSYVGTYGKIIHIWRCEDPAAPELDTDPEVQAEGYQRLLHRCIWNSAILLFMDLGLWVLLICGFFVGDSSLLDMLRNAVPGSLICAAIYTVLSVVVGYWETREICRAVKRLRAGIAQEHRKDYWKKRILMQAFSGVLLIVCLWNSGIIVSREGKDAYADHGRVPVAQAVYPDLAMIEEVPQESLSFFKPKTKFSELAPRMWFIRQYADHEDGTQSAMHTEYYHMLTQFLAQKLGDELVEEFQSIQHESGEMQFIEPGKLDSFQWMMIQDREHGDYQFAVAVSGRNVMSFEYRGTTDLREYTDYFATLLKET